MAKRTIEIDDTLPDIVTRVEEEVKEALLDYLRDNPDTDTLPDYGNDLDYRGRMHELVDGAVPIYTHEIDTIFYLHGNDVESAFDDAGIGEKSDEHWPSGWRAAAIYCYLEQAAREWYDANAEEVYDDWKAQRDAAREAEEREEEEEEARIAVLRQHDALTRDGSN